MFRRQSSTVITLPSTYSFFYDTATTEIYTLSLHDALPIFRPPPSMPAQSVFPSERDRVASIAAGRCRQRPAAMLRSEEHTSELQSPYDLVCRLLLEKKNKKSKKLC